MNRQRNFRRNAKPITGRCNYSSTEGHGIIKESDRIYTKRYLAENGRVGKVDQPPAKRPRYEVKNAQWMDDGSEMKGFHRIGFRLLESIANMENSEDVLKEISAKKLQLLQFLDCPYNLDDCDRYILLLKIFSKVAKSAFIEMKSQLLIEITKSKFFDNLQNYIIQLPYQTEVEKQRNRLFWNDFDGFWHNLLSFCESIHNLSPNYAFQKCRPLLDMSITLCVPFLKEKHNFELPEEHRKRFHAMKEAFSIQEKQPQGKNHEGYGQAPNDFRTLSLFPSTEDLLQGRGFVRPNIIDGCYESVEHYLDVQFRLLREDCYGPLRIGLQQFRKDESRRKYDNVRVYRNVLMVQPTMTQNQFGILVQWDTTKRQYSRTIKWEQSKRLMFGSLLVFIQEDFKDLIIGTVLNRDGKLLSEGLVVVQLYNVQNICDKNLYRRSYSMLESQVYFEPYLHVLKALQDPEFSEHLAMSKYIVKVNHTPVPPDYLMKTTLTLDTTNGQVKYTVLYDATWPDHKSLGLDESQCAAYRSALTQEFVVIQGPPGTGKTYLGVLIAKTLLENFNECPTNTVSSFKNTDIRKCNDVKSNFQCRLLVLCYTNHALDQFLEYIRLVTESIVRIGGQSRNANLDEFNLKNKRRTEHNSGSFKEARYELEDANSQLTVCQKNINIFNDGVYSYASVKTVCPDVIFLNNYPGVHEDPLFNWLFENVADAEYVPDAENNQDYEESECHGDNAMFCLDDVDINADRRSFYENASNIKSSFLVEKVHNYLKELHESQNKLQESQNKFEIMSRIIYYRSCLALFQNMIKHRHQLTKLNIQNGRAYQFTTEERWSIYFVWAAKLKENLMNDFQSLKEQQEKKFIAYEEARMLMDLQILRRARVVGVTTTGAARIRKLLQALKAPIVIVEEAAEVLEAHIISALTKHCQHLILIGDHQQLRPSAAHYKLARRFNMEVSLFERMVRTGASTSRLRLQHRMRPEIAALISPAIYPDLQNHPSVLHYPSVRGLASNILFFTHDNREKFEEELLSRSNHFEADMLLRLANYIMQQGYKSEDITILTTYATQMFYMKNNRRMYPYLQEVKITLVDKYQGEESKIILLSLVRNNDEGEVGFLATDNRVCVALSRAKEGLYIMGNMNILKKKSELWTKIATTLEANSALGTRFMMKCQQHPENITEIYAPEDFVKVPEGGCMRKCKTLLKCGHCCPSLCHSYDKQHERIVCKEKCNRLCELSHPCTRKCADPCPPCKVLVTKELPCKHTVEKYCHIKPENVQCLEEITAKLPDCGHEVKKLCHLQNVKCVEKCNLRLDCGHTCRRNCHVTFDPDHEQYKCKQKCERKKSGCTAALADDDDFGNHKCLKLCHEDCDPCDVEVAKRHSECGHPFISKCSSTIICTKKCGRKLPCGHYCREECYKPCICMRLVTKEISDCGHKVKIACSVNPTRKDCVQGCERILKCGHTCVRKCSQECFCNKSAEAPKPLLCGHNIVSCKIINGDMFEEEPIRLLSMCMTKCDALLTCGHRCTGSCVRCRQGRLHVPCALPCDRTLICGHLCEEKCNVGCPPCDKQCEVACAHNRCPEKCGTPCVTCKEACGRVCRHGACRRNCGARCSREPCNERCPLTLPCGHRCRGLCGELCPPLCAVCRPDDFPTPLLGDRYEDDDLFIVLKDCGHCMEVSEADMMMQSEPDGEVHVRRCPVCRKPIINTSRYKDIVNRLFRSEINPIKRRLYGDEKEVQENRCKIATKILEVAINSKVSDVIIHAEIFTHCTRVLRYLHGNKKLSLPRLNALMVITDILEIIYEYVKRFISGNLTEFQEYFMDSVKVLLKMVTNDLKTISEQQQLDVSNEIKRLRYVLQLATLVADSTYKAGKHLPAVKSAYDSAVEAVTTWRVFDETAAVEALKKLETESKASGIVTKEERDLVVRALNMKPGHWYKCPNDHFYCIGECGGAMERGSCPDCGATVGGANHALASGNRHAGELDGSRHPAWSEAANMANYQH